MMSSDFPGIVSPLMSAVPAPTRRAKGGALARSKKPKEVTIVIPMGSPDQARATIGALGQALLAHVVRHRMMRQALMRRGGQ